MNKKLLVSALAVNLLFSAGSFASETPVTTAVEVAPVVTQNALSEEEQLHFISKKTSAYINAKNALGDLPLGGTSPWAAQETKVKAALKKKDFRAVRTIGSFSVSSMERLKENLNKALAIKEIRVEAIDSRAEKVVILLDKLLPVWEELDKYNKTKKYEDDKGARGKELIELFVPTYDEAMAVYAELSDEIGKAANEMNQKRMERLKQEGRLLELYTDESLDLARQMLSEFNTAKDFKNKAKIEKANALLVQLEQKLEEQEKEYNKAKEEGKKPSSYYESVTSYLNSFVGNYREARKNASYANSMIRDYNNAVEYYNRIR